MRWSGQDACGNQALQEEHSALLNCLSFEVMLYFLSFDKRGNDEGQIEQSSE
jgi:hypothetical protein